MADWLPWLFVGALVSFGLGWLAARIDIRQVVRESRAMPSAYFRGLNFLMNEEPDKAIDAFIEVSKAHPEVVELQFALGSLFRRRGEADRAIRVHQELIERSGLEPAMRNAATLELARDFQKAGLLDHAERALNGLLPALPAGDALRHEALVLLKDICVQAREWDRAVDAATLLQREFRPVDAATGIELAQFHCERAEDLVAKDRAAAERELDAALAANPRCVRAILLRGDWLKSQGDMAGALACWRGVERQDPAYLGLVAARIMDAQRSLGREPDGIAELARWQETHPSLEAMRVQLGAVQASQGTGPALVLAQEQLNRHPTLVGLDRLYEAQAAQEAAGDGLNGSALALRHQVVHAHAEKLAVYLCANCGFKARQFFWHCPACGGWESFAPRLTAELDTAERHLFREHAEPVRLS